MTVTDVRDSDNIILSKPTNTLFEPIANWGQGRVTVAIIFSLPIGGNARRSTSLTRDDLLLFLKSQTISFVLNTTYQSTYTLLEFKCQAYPNCTDEEVGGSSSDTTLGEGEWIAVGAMLLLLVVGLIWFIFWHHDRYQV